MWKMHNPNPNGKAVGDCTVRAISIATDKPWLETYLDLCLFGMLMADMPSSNAVTTAYLKSRGFKRRTIPDDYPQDYTVSDFCTNHPNGIYVLGTGTHVVAIVDGCYCDSWDSGNETPVYYFVKEDQ